MIAISIIEKNLDSKIDNCFGKSKFFIFIDEKDKKYEFIDNPGYESKICSGRDAAFFLIKKGIKTVISGNFGIKVKRIFDRYKVQIVIPSDKIDSLLSIPAIKDIIIKN